MRNISDKPFRFVRPPYRLPITPPASISLSSHPAPHLAVYFPPAQKSIWSHKGAEEQELALPRGMTRSARGVAAQLGGKHIGVELWGIMWYSLCSGLIWSLVWTSDRTWQGVARGASGDAPVVFMFYYMWQLDIKGNLLDTTSGIVFDTISFCETFWQPL